VSIKRSTSKKKFQEIEGEGKWCCPLRRTRTQACEGKQRSTSKQPKMTRGFINGDQWMVNLVVWDSNPVVLG